ncbi:hypothetical protein GCM10010508_63020 [Streptomyces naganishii JCM 4654]|uniref:Mutator family transposase n=1 Tax=Streptomyces naganishii JCM 4654 TaxID=1306179 RepID=A0A919CZA5_9ACTN|nr:hypothetical protein GCM10010508_63020 [Streptomyces naganishii JCM 4654]
MFVDAINVEIRGGQVANRPVSVVMAVTVEDTRDILGIWAGDGGEGAKYWLHVFTELKNRGLGDVLMLVCDGLKGPPEAVEAVWPRAIVQTCVVHLLRNSYWYAARQDWDKVAGALKPVYTAPSEDAATIPPTEALAPDRSHALQCGSQALAVRPQRPSVCLRRRRLGDWWSTCSSWTARRRCGRGWARACRRR